MSGLTFEPWPKIARLNRDCIITEKIDGTNAAVIVEGDGTTFTVGAQSRSRLITPYDDNFGFARWVYDNAEMLAATLGPGRHFGEWWGSGIQRRYGLNGGERRFSLFNVRRYAESAATGLVGLGVVPTLYTGPFTTEAVREAVSDLRAHGSHAAPGFDRPEGVVVFHIAAQTVFKVTCEKDDAPKGVSA